MPGQSNRIKIESYLVIESNVFAEIKLNRTQIESNGPFEFLYDLIEFDFDKNLNKKKSVKQQEKYKKLQNIFSNGILRYLCLYSRHFF